MLEAFRYVFDMQTVQLHFFFLTLSPYSELGTSCQATKGIPFDIRVNDLHLGTT